MMRTKIKRTAVRIENCEVPVSTFGYEITYNIYREEKYYGKHY